MTVLLAGIRTESPLAWVAEQLEALGVETLIFHQRDFDRSRIQFTLHSGQITGRLCLGGAEIPLDAITGVYLRLMDDQSLPELADQDPGSEPFQHCRALHDTLLRWSDITPARVVNRVAAMGSNASKPYQAQLIRREGFHVPKTLISNEPQRIREFIQATGRVVYKSISGVRSIVQEFSEADDQRLEAVKACPVQFQEYVDGTNVRVHTIGQSVMATQIETTGTDYRYAHDCEGGSTSLAPAALPENVSERCLQLAASLGLDFAGIDLNLASDGRVFCFEVNPCPAYSYYQSHTGQPIATVLARYLACLDPPHPDLARP